ncbi:MAG: hypothetical protein WDA71_03325 [Actinomycetota bacterium]
MPLSEQALRIYRIERIPKFLATLDAQGRPNVALITSLEPWNEDRVIFGDFLMWKTRENLLAQPKVASIAATTGLSFTGFTGDFEGFHSGGEYTEHIKATSTFRYNPYNSIRGAGTITVCDGLPVRRISRATVAADILCVKLRARTAASGGVAMGPVVAEKFDRISAFKVFAWVGADGYPVVVPVLSTFPAGQGHLAFKVSSYNERLKQLADGTLVAVNVTTTDPISYQVKGTFEGFACGLGRVEITDVYSSSPPLAGQRIA